MYKQVAPKKAMQCVKEIMEWLLKHDIESSVCIYVCGKRYSFYKTNAAARLVWSGYNGLQENVGIWVEDNVDPHRYFEYVANDHFISMSFEGPLYEILNFYGDFADYDARRVDEFDAILKKYGYYYELGNSWNLSCYKI